MLEELGFSDTRTREIAHHYHSSLLLGGYDRVSAAALKAAREAEAVLAFDDAARFHEWAREARALDEAVLARGKRSEPS